MEKPQGGLLEGAETGLPGLAASPGGCAHAPEQTAMSHANALGACPLEVQELKPPRSADGDPEQPRAPRSADGDPEQPRPPRSAEGDPEQPRAPRSADGDPEQPRPPRSAEGDPEQPRAPRSADGDPEQPRPPRSAEGDPEQPRAPASADGDPEQPRAPRSADGDPEQPRAPASAEGDLECLICCHRYRWERPPKVLSCQHTFCAVCLRLLLTVREDTWSVTCPLCRAATSVPGGLVCNLRDQAEILGRLARFAPEVRLAPQYLARPAGGELPGVGGEAGEDSESVNRVAARRLAVHLLLLGLLIFLILPFVYPGAFGWFLVSAMCAALLLSSAFCCLPGGRDCWGPAKALLPGQQKHSHVAAIA
ncbi:E3 ubiquitin-protein ligase RNF186 [Sminthopsis crassicaudata]|uniref:E3 ubiquitin-protein ligase RNF186 n=1 Tax=Sminthopsis crassicaudata TaxID=9301 RepID=UPI003D69F0C5